MGLCYLLHYASPWMPVSPRYVSQLSSFYWGWSSCRVPQKWKEIWAQTFGQDFPNLKMRRKTHFETWHRKKGKAIFSMFFSPFLPPWLLVMICSLHWASAMCLDNLWRRVPKVSALTEQPILSAPSASPGPAPPVSCPACCPPTHMPSKPSFSSFRKPSKATTSTRKPLHPKTKWPRSR